MANWNQSRMLYIYAGDGDGSHRCSRSLQRITLQHEVSLSVRQLVKTKTNTPHAHSRPSPATARRNISSRTRVRVQNSAFARFVFALPIDRLPNMYIYMHDKHMWQTLSLNAHNDWRKTLFTFMTWQRVLMHIHIIVCDYIEKYAAAAYTPYNVFESNI